MKKMLLILAFVLGTIWGFFSETALVTVTSEKTLLIIDISETGGLQSVEIYKGDIFLITDCDTHQWRKAIKGTLSGSINLQDVNVLFGNLPECDYVPSIAPPGDLPDDVWKKKFVPDYQHRC